MGIPNVATGGRSFLVGDARAVGVAIVGGVARAVGVECVDGEEG